MNQVNGFVLVPLLLTLNRFHTMFCVSIVDFELINADWEINELIMHKVMCSIIFKVNYEDMKEKSIYVLCPESELIGKASLIYL